MQGETHVVFGRRAISVVRRTQEVSRQAETSRPVHRSSDGALVLRRCTYGCSPCLSPVRFLPVFIAAAAALCNEMKVGQASVRPAGGTLVDA